MGRWLDEALRIKPYIQRAIQSLNDTDALEIKTIYPKWKELIDENHEFHTAKNGFKFMHEDTLYKTEQPEYTFIEMYVPGEIGTESLFSKVDEVHTGTIDNAIPYDGNMALESGKYYSQGGVTYYCMRDTVNPVYHNLSDLVGTYVEVV